MTFLRNLLPGLLLVTTGLGFQQALASQESAVYRYDSSTQSFIMRGKTTLRKPGEFISAKGIELDKGSPAYQALINNHSFEGEITISDQVCRAFFAPLTDTKNQLTGALFVGTNCHLP